MTDPLGTEHWPVELKLKQAEKRLEVTFEDGARFSLPAEYLRVESPSAEVQGHSPSQKQIVSGRADVGIVRLEPIGHYGVRVVFDDGHDTGIFSWRYLYELGQQQTTRWSSYLEALARGGLTRETRPRPAGV